MLEGEYDLLNNNMDSFRLAFVFCIINFDWSMYLSNENSKNQGVMVGKDHILLGVGEGKKCFQ